MTITAGGENSSNNPATADSAKAAETGRASGEGWRTPAFDAALAIVETLRADGHPAYFAGGSVRDLLLGFRAKDIDVATSAPPGTVQTLFPRTLSVGAAFGVILVRSGARDETGAEITTEVATFRNDGAYSDGRRPDSVRYSTDPREDVRRRDFTINGMLLDPVRLRDSGHVAESVLDFVGGRDDLSHRIVRAIGDPMLRFTEDKLRMLRAVRFAARLGFAIDPATMQAMLQLAPAIHQVSPERTRDELTRMFTEGHARRAFELLDDSGLLAEVLPEATHLHGVEQPPEWHPEGDVWTHTMLMLERLPAGVSPTLAWAALLHDVGKPATFHIDRSGKHGHAERIRFNGHVDAGVRISEEILRRLRFSNEDSAQIVALVKNHMRFGDVPQMKESTLKRFLRLPRFDEHLELHWLDCTACHGRLGIWEQMKQRYETAPAEEVRPQLFVTGRDLIKAGYKPSSQFKTMLDLAEDAQLEGLIHSTTEGLALIRESFGDAPAQTTSDDAAPTAELTLRHAAETSATSAAGIQR